MDENEILFEDYDIAVVPGTNDELIIALCSIGDPGKIPVMEWKGTVAQIGGRQHAIFMRDRVKSWYNSRNGWDAMIGWIKDYCARHDIKRIYAFGLSMGGFGAAILARYLPLRRTLMLAPQASTRPEVYFDMRFRHYWEQITDPHCASIGDIGPCDTEFACVYTVDTLWDTLHAGMIHEALPDCHFIPIHGDHNVGGELQERQEHLRLLRWLMDREIDHGVTMFRGMNDDVFNNSRLVMVGDQEQIDANVNAIIRTRGFPAVPGILFDSLSPALRRHLLNHLGSPSKARKLHAYPLCRGVNVMHDRLKPYLAEGWSKIEHFGFWSEGEQCRIRAHMIDTAAQAPVLLVLHAQLFIAPGRRRTLRITQRDKILAEHELFNPESHPINKPMALSLEVAGPLIDLVIHTPDPIAPSEVSNIPDRRQLGLWLQGLKVRYRPPPPPRQRPAPPPAPAGQAPSQL